MSDKAIKIQSVDFSYGKKKVLSDITLDIPAQSIFFIMGNNGSGKTTLLKCLLNNVSIQTGRISIFGKNVSEISREGFARTVSYVPQNININCNFKVKDYLVLGRNPYIPFGNPSDRDYEIVEEYSNKTGISDFLEYPFDTLSGGQKQWCAITRALVQETEIIVMDEPTAALDMGKQAELLILLRELREKYSKTIILTSHNPNHCLVLDAQVCLLHNNHVYAVGKPREVFSKENIQEIYGTHICLVDGNRIEMQI